MIVCVCDAKQRAKSKGVCGNQTGKVSRQRNKTKQNKAF